MTAQDILTHKYGMPNTTGFAGKWMKLWPVKAEFNWFPATTLCIHKDFVVKLQAAFTGLQQNNLHTEIKTFDGAFNIRLVRGSSSIYSVHAWGCAIDLNAAQNPLASAGKWSAAFIHTMETNGIFCGQHFHGRKDPMHFALVNG